MSVLVRPVSVQVTVPNTTPCSVSGEKTENVVPTLVAAPNEFHCCTAAALLSARDIVVVEPTEPIHEFLQSVLSLCLHQQGTYSSVEYHHQ